MAKDFRQSQWFLAAMKEKREEAKKIKEWNESPAWKCLFWKTAKIMEKKVEEQEDIKKILPF